jgi:hypothetical protein
LLGVKNFKEARSSFTFSEINQAETDKRCVLAK